MITPIAHHTSPRDDEETAEHVAERGTGENAIDFATANENVRCELLKPFDTLELTARARNRLLERNIRVVGQLAMLPRENVRRWTNLGRKTLRAYEILLGASGLFFGTVIRNWPNDHELEKLLQTRASTDLDRVRLPAAGIEFIEDELSAIVEAAVDPRHRAIFLRRSGWDGGTIHTLEKLGSEPEASGLDRVVTRERIRQIEVKAARSITRRSFVTPILDKAIEEVADHAPVFVPSIPRVIYEKGLSRAPLEWSVLKSAMELLGRDWGHDFVFKGSMLARSEDVEELELYWRRISNFARQRDFGCIDDVPRDATDVVDEFATVADKIIEMDPDLVWLDRNRGVFCSARRIEGGRCKISKVCRKVFTVTSQLSLGRLCEAVSSARTVRKHPSIDILRGILELDGNFNVRGDIVHRDSDFECGRISESDIWMIEAAKDLGTVTGFLRLREHLVRLGLSSNYAQVLIMTSPLWIAYARGRYRFVASSQELEALELSADADNEGFDEEEGPVAEFGVTHRHLVTGKQRIPDLKLTEGSWRVVDYDGVELGFVEVVKGRLEGLREVFERGGIDVGSSVRFAFDEEGVEAVLSVD